MSITSDIEKLKKEKNAVILAHYYVDEDVQEIADYIGDSFYLSKVATKVDQDIIVFAGVEFMGESAKILNPDKKVLMPEPNADCPMAHMATKEEIMKMREEYEDLAVVCYINSTAELKTYSDVCVTSSNAVKIVKNLPNKNIFFIPDQNLGRFVAKQVPEKNVICATSEICQQRKTMSKILILSGSPRKNGNTELLARSFLLGARDGNEVEMLSVSDLCISPCRGCNTCYLRGKQGCAIDDDMQVIYEKMLTTDVLVIASPVYFYGLSAQIKTVIDRFHTPFRDSFKVRAVVLLLVGASRLPALFDPILLQYRMILDFFKLEDLGVVTVDGVRDKGDIMGHPALKRAYDLGRSLR